MTTQTDRITEQINQCTGLLNSLFGHDLLGLYLYGSAVAGGLQKFSDIDLFVVTNRPATGDEKMKLANALLEISGIYMKSSKPPIELTLVVESEINPWRYPPRFDFQYGEWLREQFAQGNIEPGADREMPDLALLITQVLLASRTLIGIHPNQLLPKVPYKDFIAATMDALPSLSSEVEGDTRNVLLTLARIWRTLVTDTICSKPAAADWAISRLPEKYRPVLLRAKAICRGDEIEHWDDMREIIRPCVDFMMGEIKNAYLLIENTGYAAREIELDGNS